MEAYTQLNNCFLSGVAHCTPPSILSPRPGTILSLWPGAYSLSPQGQANRAVSNQALRCNCVPAKGLVHPPVWRFFLEAHFSAVYPALLDISFTWRKHGERTAGGQYGIWLTTVACQWVSTCKPILSGCVSNSTASGPVAAVTFTNLQGDFTNRTSYHPNRDSNAWASLRLTRNFLVVVIVKLVQTTLSLETFPHSGWSPDIGWISGARGWHLRSAWWLELLGWEGFLSSGETPSSFASSTTGTSSGSSSESISCRPIVSAPSW